MAVAWITEIQNLSDTDYKMWCDVAPGPLAYLGLFNGHDRGNDKVPITPGSRYHVEWCAVPWNNRKHYRYLRGPSGTIRMYCTTFADADKLVFVDDASEKKLGALPIGAPHSAESERVWFSLVISDNRIDFDVMYSTVVPADILNGVTVAAEKLALDLRKVLNNRQTLDG